MKKTNKKKEEKKKPTQDISKIIQQALSVAGPLIEKIVNDKKKGPILNPDVITCPHCNCKIPIIERRN